MKEMLTLAAVALFAPSFSGAEVRTALPVPTKVETGPALTKLGTSDYVCQLQDSNSSAVIAEGVASLSVALTAWGRRSSEKFMLFGSNNFGHELDLTIIEDTGNEIKSVGTTVVSLNTGKSEFNPKKIVLEAPARNLKATCVRGDILNSAP